MTAETAAMLPALMIVLAAGVWTVQVVGAQLECVDAARAAARAAARGEPPDRVRQIARSAVRPGASVELHVTLETTRAEVSLRMRPTWGLPLPPVIVSASSTTITEP
ncbi:TadE family type IV pilus minor pilin [Nonomuraea sp. NPDC050328]|uniref:TadE family type IV pilus minor pilin n=1 Tax=Nonomuraea sp. NPDC050328 TaxID=3364361 RepID=UPI00379D2420